MLHFLNCRVNDKSCPHGFFPFGREHGFAAVRRATAAGIIAFDCRRMPAVDDQAVVVAQFLAGLNIAQSVNKDAAVFFVGFAIRFTCMIDPACIVAASISIDHASIIEAEEESMVRVCRIAAVPQRSFFDRDPLALVFDDAGTGRDDA